MPSLDRGLRAARHAALGDPTRLAIVDELSASDRAPIELARQFGVAPNLLAHHLDVLEGVGLVTRRRSSGDGRRRYVRLVDAALDGLAPEPVIKPGRTLFVCTRNSARSQLAAAVWRSMVPTIVESAGTFPAPRVHPGAVAAAERAQLPFEARTPRSLDAVKGRPDLVITVCDEAHEDLDAPAEWLHWSIADPINAGTARAFDDTVVELRQRTARLFGRPTSPPVR